MTSPGSGQCKECKGDPAYHAGNPNNERKCGDDIAASLDNGRGDGEQNRPAYHAGSQDNGGRENGDSIAGSQDNGADDRRRTRMLFAIIRQRREVCGRGA